MKLILVTLLVFVLIFGVVIVLTPTNGEVAQAIQNAGYANPVVSTHHLLVYKCNEGDNYYFDVTATSPHGNPVNLYVCKGIFRGFCVYYRY